ncbi:MAG: class A beta-lactamase, partial [Desulfovibrionaceae bacterium]|nr:class A beta-lactamase [Desulfovibrionaceae bacterium]
MAALEAASGGRLGAAVIDMADGKSFSYRGEERFPLCSTFKVVAVGAVLQRTATEHGLLRRRIRFARQDMVPWSPVTSHHIADGMTVEELCAAALQQSDNTAANLLLDLLGGPRSLTAFARSLGDDAFRLDRCEPELNASEPGDPRDTTTPEAMAATLRSLVFGPALEPAQSAVLWYWLRGKTTGA